MQPMIYVERVGQGLDSFWYEIASELLQLEMTPRGV